MANEKVTFAKGNTPLPTDMIPGRLIVAEDTGDTYLDTEINKRIQLKDGTKVANVNGQVAGYLDVSGTISNTMLGDNSGSVIAGRSLKSNSSGSFIGGNGNDIGTADKIVRYVVAEGQGNRLNASYTILDGLALFENSGIAVCIGGYAILDSNYSVLSVLSSYTKMKAARNSITVIDCTAADFSPANEEASRVELTSDLLSSWRTQGKIEQIAQYNRICFVYGSCNSVSGANNYVSGTFCTTNGQFNKQIDSNDSTVSGEFNVIKRNNNIVIGDRNEGDSIGQMFEIFGTDSYSSGQGMLVGNHLIDKDGYTPKLVLGQCNAIPTTPSYLVVGSGTTTDYLTVADIPDNASKTVGVNGDIHVNIESGYPNLTIVEGNTPTAIPDDAYDKLYKVPTTDTTVYKLMVGFGFGGTGAAHPNYPTWKKYSDWKLIGYVVKELPTVGESGIIYYQIVHNSSDCIVCFYSNNSWHLNRITNLSSPFRVAVFQDIQRKNSLEIHTDDVMQLLQFPEVGQSDAVPSPTKPGQLVNKKYVDELNAEENFKLVVKHTIVEGTSEQACYFSNEWIEDESGQATAGAAFNFKELLVQMNIPVIDSSSSDNYTCNMFTLLNTDQASNANNRVAIMSMTWKKNTASNIAIHSEIRGGRIFTDSGYSAGNTSNRNVKDGGYCNVGALVADNITSVMLQSLTVAWPTGTVITIYGR